MLQSSPAPTRTDHTRVHCFHQAALASAVLAATSKAGIPTALVLVHGGALAIEEFKLSADAILDVHYPGTATGAAAVADCLYGRFSPAGKLP